MKPTKVQPLGHFSLCHCSLDNVGGFVPCEVLSEIHKGQCVLKICFSSPCTIKGYCFFHAVGAAGVFGCDRQELDMKRTANSKYDLINYICQ